jgi:copper ion binding protein
LSLKLSLSVEKGEKMFGKKENEVTLKVEGMTCDHCVMHVTSALEEIDGVSKAKVSLKKNEALVKFDAPATEELMGAAVLAAGYKVV